MRIHSILEREAKQIGLEGNLMPISTSAITKLPVIN